MGLFDLITNTVEGVIQTPLSATKAVAGIVVAPLDDGDTIESGVDGVVEGINKIGDAEKRREGQ